MKNTLGVGVTLFAAVLLGSCGGSDLSSGTPGPNQAAAIVAVPGLSSTANFSFDLGIVVNGKYYLTDRNNKAVDVVDVISLQITQIKGTGALAFTGVSPAGNGRSGPDGINFISTTGQLYVGDVDGVKVVDPASATVTGSIRVGTTGTRADEGCFDPDHNIYMVSSPDADIPFASFISTTTQTVLATVTWVDTDGNAAGGNEQCQYDHGTQSFLVNNDNTIVNPHGEVDVITVASIRALPPGTTTNFLSLTGLKRFPLGNCDPTGMDFGPGLEMAVMCRPGDAGSPLVTLIMNRTTGAVVATVPFGGGDQLAYDARTNRYYLTGNRWRPSGRNDSGTGCNTANPCTPTLGIVDASSHAIVTMIPVGNNAHSVAVDPVRGEIFVPQSSAGAPAGCATCTANGFINPGISVFFSPGF